MARPNPSRASHARRDVSSHAALPDFPPERTEPTWVVWELIYNPNPTLFVQRARQQGAAIETGMLFFRKQAERSLAIWERMWLERYRPRIRSAS